MELNEKDRENLVQILIEIHSTAFRKREIKGVFFLLGLYDILRKNCSITEIRKIAAAERLEQLKELSVLKKVIYTAHI